MFSASVSQWTAISDSMDLANDKGLRVTMYGQPRMMNVKVIVTEDGGEGELVTRCFGIHEAFFCAQWIARVALDYGSWK